MGPSIFGEMLRRRAASSLLALGLLTASVAYTGTVVRSIVVDDHVAMRAAEAALDDERVHDLLVRETTAALESQLFADAFPALGADVSDDARAVAEAVVADPAFTTAFVDTVRGLHRVALVERGPAPELDASPLVGVARDAAIARNPAYGELIPPAATVRVALPADDLPDLTGVSSLLADRAKLAAVAAVALVGAAFAVHPKRPRVVRRIGTWALGIAVVQGAAAFGIAYLAERVPGDLAPIATAVAETLRPRLVVPAAMMAAAGLALVIGAWRWQRTIDATHERLGASAFLAHDPDDEPTALREGAIEVATLRSPMGAPPVPLTRASGGGSFVSPGNEPVPTMRRGA